MSKATTIGNSLTITRNQITTALEDGITDMEKKLFEGYIQTINSDFSKIVAIKTQLMENTHLSRENTDAFVSAFAQLEAKYEVLITTIESLLAGNPKITADDVNVYYTDFIDDVYHITNMIEALRNVAENNVYGKANSAYTLAEEASAGVSDAIERLNNIGDGI